MTIPSDPRARHDPVVAAEHPPEIPDFLEPLNAMQRAFAVQYVATSGHGTKAALAAGYSKACAPAMASRNLHNPLIAQAIHKLSVLALGAHVPAAVGTIGRLVRRAKSEYVRLEASKDILDRVGMRAPTKVAVSGQVSVSIDLS
jgi:hypothetical protein